MIDFYILTLQISMLVVGALIMLFSIDDLLVDGWFWTREIYRGLVIRPRYKPLPESALHERAQQPLAIMIPSWQEDAVIGAMIENTVQVLDYENYRIFVGTYPNDAATIAEVERARRRHKRVVRVQTPHSGPTSKADCLNHILAAIRQEELDTGREYAGVVMHDCEDVLHPLELKFFNYLLPRKDMIQLPVVALERGLSELIAGTYMDEFAEWHAKDLVVRDSFAGTVPSAGVGTCFSHKAIVELRNGKGQPFNTKTLTEDYDVGERLAAKGLRAIIARYDVDYRVRGQGRDADADAEGYVTVRMPLCVREYFPNTFHTARRQKARWMIGIALQGWTQLGWTKSFRTNYFLARDRKALLSAPLVVAAYVLLLNYTSSIALIGWERLTYSPAWQAVVVWVFGFNTVALMLRIAQRMYFVNRIYGWRQALVSAPRMVAGTLVSFAATLRAVRIYAGYLITHKPIAWDKTTHQFPSAAVLDHERRRLGEILSTWEAITPVQLETALGEQGRTKQSLGKIMMATGWLDDETLAEAISTQSELPRATVTAETMAQFRGAGFESLWIRLRAAPIGIGPDGGPILAVARPLSIAQREAVKSETGFWPFERIARESEVTAALRTLRGAAYAPREGAPPLLGDILVRHGQVSAEAVDAALDSYRPDRDGRIGEHLVRLGVVSAEAIAAAVTEQDRLARDMP